MKQQIKTSLAGGLLALALFSTAQAGPLEDAEAAYRKSDFATALQIWRPLAEQRNAEAQTRLGAMYQYGQGVPQDYAQALILRRKAADQGYARGQIDLGGMYEVGDGVTQDYAQALAWYRKAAEQGDAWGQFVLGARYQLGQGVPQDYVRAHMWMNLAASHSGDKDDVQFFAQMRNELAAKMTPAQITEAQRMASEWRLEK
jgi:TPR repeat protein